MMRTITARAVPFHSGVRGNLTVIRTEFDDTCDRAGIPQIPVHELWHTFCSQMPMVGADTFASQLCLWHKDIKTTMVYV